MIDFKSIDKKGKIDSVTTRKVQKTGQSSFEKELNSVNVLEDAFHAFNDASESLKDHYGLLEKRVSELNRELAGKSADLEENLKKTSQMERYQSSILRNLSSAVIVLDSGGKITTFNKRAEEITGFFSDEIKGKPLEVISNNSDLTKKIAHSSEDSEMIYSNKKGDPLFLRISTSFLIDEYGRREGTIIILHDLTKEKMLEESMERGKRLAAMGEMAAKLAHEIRNPLGGIELFASNLKKHLAGNERARNMAENICSGVASLNYLVSNTLQFARMKEPVLKEMSVNESIDEALLLASHLIDRYGINISKAGLNFYTVIMADREMIKLSFLNVIINAVQAMTEGGTLNISLVEEKNEMIKIVFGDNGDGMSDEIISRVFDPFYSTKESGSGLGLAIVYNIVNAHHGTVTFNSEKNKGTDVIISLPKS